MSKLALLKLAVAVAILVAVVEPSNKLFGFLHKNSIMNQNHPSDKKLDLSDAKKMDDEPKEIKRVPLHERTRREVENNSLSNGLKDSFLDGCSRSDYEASVIIILGTLLLNNEKNKTKYLEDKLAFLKGELQKQKNETGAFEVRKLYKIVREKKHNITNQLKSQRQKANATIIEKSNEILKKKQDNLDLKDSYKKQIAEVNRNMQNKINEEKTIKLKETEELNLESSENEKVANCNQQFPPNKTPSEIKDLKKKEYEANISRKSLILLNREHQKNCCKSNGC